MNYTQLTAYASSCQIEADKTAYRLITERETTSKYWCLQEYCSFNVRGLMLLRWHMDFIEFTIHHGSELRRPFTLSEFLTWAQRYRIIRLRFDPKSFAELKKIKIKPIISR